MKGSYRTDFYRSNRDYGGLLREGKEAMQEEEEEEEEDFRPQNRGNTSREDEVSIERQEYLRRRQKLKELERKKLKGKSVFSDSSITKSVVSNGGNRSTTDREKKRHLPYDNYGSFFGPSEPVVARRIIEEVHAKEAETLAINKVEKNVLGPTIAHSPEHERPSSNFPSTEKPVQKVVDEEAMRKQRLRENRDYGFLFSDEDPLASVPESKPAPANQEKERSKQHHSQVQKVPVNLRKGPLQSKPGSSVADLKQKVSRMEVTKTPVNSNKLVQSMNKPLKSANGNLTDVKKSISQSSFSNKAVTHNSMSNLSKFKNDLNVKTHTTGKMTKNLTPSKSSSMSNVPHKRSPARSVEQRKQTSVSHAQQRMPASAAGSSRLPSGIKPVKGRGDPSGFKKEQRRERDYDSEDSFLDDEEEDPQNISSMIRKMFGYNPNKFRDEDDEDDRNMEVGFSRIQAEERRSARIAKEEDERELALIEAEERAERARKESKKRKLK